MSHIINFLLLAVLFSGLSACEGDKTIQQYSIEKEAVSVRAYFGAGFNWKAPKTWHYRTPNNPEQLAIFVVPEKYDIYTENPHTVATASITYIEGTAGSINDNISRWRKQINLDSNVYNNDARIIKTNIGKVYLIKLQNTKQNSAILAAIYKKQTGSLFVKLRGPIKTVNQNAEKFVTFIETFSKKKVNIKW